LFVLSPGRISPLDRKGAGRLRPLLRAGKNNQTCENVQQKRVRRITKRRELFSAPLLLNHIPDFRADVRPAPPHWRF
jgi:hypothetical protein